MNKKKKIGYIIVGILAILVIITGGYYFHQKQELNSDKLSPADLRIYKKHKVTKALAQVTNDEGLNVKFIDENSKVDYNVIRTQLETGIYDSIVLYIYSDACPRCLRHIPDEQNRLGELATKKQLVLAVNRGRNIPELKKYFQLPKMYHYPTYFVYNNNQDFSSKHPLELESSHALYQ